jgi:hypothetical protein
MKRSELAGLKRVAIYFGATAEHLLRRGNPRYDTAEEGNELKLRTLIRHARFVIGPWNTGLPTTLRLQKLANEASFLADQQEGAREALVLRALSKSYRVLSLSPSVEEASDLVLELHAILLDNCAAYLSPREAYQRFAQKRCAEMRRLAGKPARVLGLSR